MPIYGYRCDSCGHELEVMQSMAEAPLTECPECGGRLRKLFYPVGVSFKGSGFHNTDYKSRPSESAPSSASSDSSSSSPSPSSSSSSSSDSKPAASSNKPAS